MDDVFYKVTVRETSGRLSTCEFAVSEEFRPTLEWILLALTRDSLRATAARSLITENSSGSLRIVIDKHLATEVSTASRLG